jgi:DNA polymerase III delta prime subunit
MLACDFPSSKNYYSISFDSIESYLHLDGIQTITNKMEKSKMSVDLTEKYRPKTFDEIVGNTKVIQAIQRLIKIDMLKDMIFYGTFGTGKTTTGIVTARTLKCYPKGCIFLNASDINKKDDIHYYVMESAKTKWEGKYKIIILDEAEALSKKAQESLKTFMERKSPKIKIIFIVNDYSKIIPAIKSRCAKFRFARIKADEMIPRLLDIVRQEGINIAKETITTIAYSSNGDMRTAINTIQTGGDTPIEEIDVKPLYDIVQKGKSLDTYKILSGLLETENETQVIDALFRYAIDHIDKEQVFLCIADLEKSIGSGFSIYVASMEFAIKVKRCFNGKV